MSSWIIDTADIIIKIGFPFLLYRNYVIENRLHAAEVHIEHMSMSNNLLYSKIKHLEGKKSHGNNRTHTNSN